MWKNYFMLFGLPERFEVDGGVLQARYRSQQLQCHPDITVGAGAQERRIHAQMSAYVNDAYRTLASPLKRAAYLLSLKGITLDSETDTQLPADFLMTQMVLRETVEVIASGQASVAMEEDYRETLEYEQQALAMQFSTAFERQDYATARQMVRKWQFFVSLETQLRFAAIQENKTTGTTLC